MPGARRTFAQSDRGAALAFLAYIALTLLLFAPLLPQLGWGLHDRSDTALNTWIIA